MRDAKSGSDKVLPKTKADKKMSIRHLKDRIKYNRAHEDDHKDARVAAEKHLKRVKRLEIVSRM